MKFGIFSILRVVFLLGLSINILVGCSGAENITLREYEVVEQLRGQPPGNIYVRTSDRKIYLFSHSNYYISNDTLFGKDYFGKELVLPNVELIHHNKYDIKQELEVYYDAENDSIVGYKYAGAKAYIEMNNGADYTGELLTVRDSILIVCEEYEADEQDLADSVYAFFVLNNRDIKLIKLSVGNYLGIGAGIGGSAGLLAGGTAAYSGPDPYGFGTLSALGGAVVGGFVGAIIGGTIGFFFTDYEDVYEQANPEEYDFKKLNIYARYVNNEPDFLENIK